MKDKLCTYCGHIGKPTSQGAGSFAVDGVIWIIGLSLSIFTGIFAFLVIPLGWSIYHIALYKTTTCPKCGNIAMVGLNSKKAEQYRKDTSQVKTVYQAENREQE